MPRGVAGVRKVVLERQGLRSLPLGADILASAVLRWPARTPRARGGALRGGGQQGPRPAP